MSVLDSIVVNFGDDADSDAVYKIGLDAQLNGNDADGNEKTSFYAGDNVHILVQLPTGYVIDRITYTSGEVINNGVVSRSDNEERKFFPDDSGESLSWWPSGNASGSKFYGRECSFTTTDDDVVSLDPPVIADISYSFNAFSLTIIHPTGLVVEEDDSWPIGVVIWAKK